MPPLPSSSQLTSFRRVAGSLLLLAALAAMLWAWLLGRIFPPYFQPWELREDSFAAVIFSVFPAGIALLLALWFFRHHFWEKHPVRWPLLAIAALFVFTLVWVGFGATLAFVAVGLVVVALVLQARVWRDDWDERWLQTLLPQVATGVVLLAVGALILTADGNAHLLSGVFGLALGAAIAGAVATAFRPIRDKERYGGGTDGKIFGQLWSWPYAPLAAAVVLQLAAVTRTWATGESINTELPGILLWLSVVVSALGLSAALRFRVFEPDAQLPPAWSEHSVGFRHLDEAEARRRFTNEQIDSGEPWLPQLAGHYLNWFFFGLALAALTWGVIELWDGGTGGTDRVSVGLLALGVALSLIAVVIWIGGLEQLRGRTTSFASYRVASSWAALLTLLGVGIPLVAVFADKADNRQLGPAASITLTEAGHRDFTSACPDAPRQLRGRVDTDTLDDPTVRVEPAPGYCDGAGPVNLPATAIAAVEEIDDLDAATAALPTDPRDGAPGRITITWQMPDRLGATLNTVRLGDDLASATIRAEQLEVPANPGRADTDAPTPLFRVILEARDPSGPARCEDARYVWRATQQGGNSGVPVTTAGCQLEVLLPEGEFNVTAEPIGRPGEPGRGVVTVQDYLIVALGDSVGSGEGNPPFRDDRSKCNRSDDSGQVLAAQKLERRDPKTSVTLLHLSCTGATMDSRTPNKNVVKQARHAKALIGNRQIDAVLLSVSANDLRFAQIVTHCITWDCAEDPLTGGIFERVVPQGGDERVVANMVPALVDRAAGIYPRLAQTISRQLEPQLVLATEYFDPSRDEDGEFCRRASAGFVEHEARLAYESIIQPLNRLVGESVSQAQATHGPEVSWQYVSGIAADFATHGYCAEPSSERWVVGTSDSPLRQLQIQGAFHPNAAGHRAIGNAIYRQLKPGLDRRG